MSKVIMNCHKTRFLHRIINLPLFLKSAPSLRIFHSQILRQHHFANSLHGVNKSFSSTSVLKSEMANCGGGDVNDFDMNYEQLLKAQDNCDILIIDVREHAEINKTGALPGSIHIPMCDVADELTKLTSDKFCEKYNRDLPTKETKLVFSCMSGKRSGVVQDRMKKLGYTNVYNYKGGWSEWEQKQKC
ncbi:rhodanese domain-containing protein CG4456-like isoform X1 [Leptopilina boulardi]|uniref:rhodanese domain-containing protein CG4456-like isoform X1 n=2 Tax=Leptopilina boulardi TaxID=63433 RepID=UPI0021F64034|nr:rhodanese domain-containing protein CG4456-like isoform X1 [Leptopilina boulardi]XP_051159849.1 rhodanese domain-containing protein CG4456-like isoform X1 [Leptopilina boulardi]